MTTATSTDQPCPECGDAQGTYWSSSTTATDVWACRCGHDWTVTVDIPEQRR